VRRGWLVALAGCNDILGIHGTKPMPDAGVQLCDPLPFDPHRYLSLESSSGTNWALARATCQIYGFDLAVIDANDSAEITNELTAGVVPFWLGVAYDGTQWNAIDTCTPELDLAPGPSPTVGECLMQNTGGMVPYDCTFAQAGSAISALCETPRPNAQCRVYAAQRDYTLIASTVTNPVTHDVGAQMCSVMGMHLVEIDSTDELDYLLAHEAQTVPQFWVGAVANGGNWASPTGCPPIFIWTAQPNQPCVFYSGAMFPTGCNTSTFPVICELNAGS
jgi:hypothetical protein